MARWTQDEEQKLLFYGKSAEDCFIGECAEEWQGIAQLLGRTPNACRTHYSKLKHGRIEAK